MAISVSPDGTSCNSDYCGLETRKIVARIKIGGFEVRTPHIINIIVSRSRGQLVSTAQVQFHCNEADNCDSAEISGPGTGIQIYIPENSILFTGTVKRIDVSPSYRCAGEKIIRIQAEDFLHRIVNRNITRRQKDPGLGVIAFITSIYKRVTVGFDSARNLHDISSTSSPIDVFTHTLNFADMNQFIKSGETNLAGNLHPVMKCCDSVYRMGAGNGGFILHDHSSLDLGGPHAGGPAKAVFGIK